MKRKKGVIIILVLGTLIIGGVIVSIALSIAESQPGLEEKWKTEMLIEGLMAIGISILSSLLFYGIYAMIAENRILQEVAKTSSDYTQDELRRRFDDIVPEHIYSATKNPTREFHDKIFSLLKSSKSYCYKGDVAGTTSYRLFRLAQENVQGPKTIQLILLDPKNRDLFFEAAKSKLHRKLAKNNAISQEDLQIQEDELIMELYITLSILFDIRLSLNISIVFNDIPPVFYIHTLTEGIFMSFYLGGDYPQTYYYKNNTNLYHAFDRELELSFKKCQADQGITCFEINSRTTDEEFHQLLKGFDFGSFLKRYDDGIKSRKENKNVSLSSLFASKKELKEALAIRTDDYYENVDNWISRLDSKKARHLKACKKKLG